MIDYELDRDGFAHVIWNNPDGPVNVKSARAIDAFARAVERAIDDRAVKGVLVRSAKRDFVAGGDLMELYAVQSPDSALAKVSGVGNCLRRMERSSKPFVAVLNGSALGGGLELALACHYRVAVDDPRLKLGSPEVTLGLIPGAGGTQRLPRLIGIAPATKMLLDGKPLGAHEALDCGLVDEVVPVGQEVNAARRLAVAHSVACQQWDKDGFKYPGFQPGSPEAAAFFQRSWADVRRKTVVEDLAPGAILAALAEGLALHMDAALKIEAQHFARVAVSASAKNRIRTQFIAPSAVKRMSQSTGLSAACTTRLGVVGAGTMGGGIALVGARSGIPTVLIDQSEAALQKGMQRIAKTLDAAVERKLMSAVQRDETLARITATTDFAQLKGCDVVVEAIVEVAEVKKAVFQMIFDAAGSNAVVATNTSTLSISRLAETVQIPHNFIGLHFFAPVDRMSLVEIIMGRQTSEQTLARAHALLRAMTKTPVVVNDGPGFYTSRVVAAYTREALHMLSEGISPELVDRAALAAGFAMGPLAMADLTSYDLLKDILTSLQQTARGTAADSKGALDAIDRLLAAGRIGRKGAGGIYEYATEGKRVWEGLAQLFPPKAQQPTEEAVIERLLNIQSIETVHVIAEGIASDPLALDLAAVLGWSYPAFRGGVLARIDDVGALPFVDRSDEMARELGSRFTVPKLLRDMAASGQTFHS